MNTIARISLFANKYKGGLNSIVVLILATLLVLMGTRVIESSEPFLATMVVSFLVLSFPGFLLLHLFTWDRTSLLERLAVSFVLSVGMWSIPATVLLRLHSNLEVMKCVVIAVTMLLCLLFVCRSLKGRTTSSRAEHPPVDKGNRLAGTISKPSFVTVSLWLAFLCSILLFVGLFIATDGGVQPYDRWGYLASIRHYLDTGRFLSKGFYISSSTTPSPRLTMNPWLVLLALVSKIAQIDPIDLHNSYLPPLLIVVSFSSFYSLARELLRSQNAALTACLIAALYYLSDIFGRGGGGLNFFLRIVEDKFLLWLIVLPVGSLLMLRYLLNGTTDHFVILAVSTAAFTLIHPIGLTLYGISFGAFAFFYLIFNWEKENIIRVATVLILLLTFLIVPLMQRQEMASAAPAIFEQRPEARVLDVLAGHSLYMVSPHLIEHPLIILAILLMLLLIKYVRRGVSAQFLLSNMIVPLVLLYIPVFPPLLEKLVTPQLVWRICWILPVPLVISFFLSKTVKWLQGQFEEDSPWTRSLLLMPTAVILLTGLLLRGNITRAIERLETPDQWRKVIPVEARTLLTYACEHVIPGSTIFAEPMINNLIPSMVGHSYGLTFRYLPPRLPSALEDLDRFYQAPSVLNSRLEILQKYDARYLVLQTDSPLDMRFRELYPAFQRIYRNREFSLYEARPGWQENPLVHHLITASTLYAVGNYAEAEDQCKLALQIAPGNIWARQRLADSYMAQGEFDQAITEYEKAVAASPDDVWPRLYLAKAYLAKGEIAEESEAYEKALAAYRQAFTLAPGDSKVRDALLKAYLILGDQYFEQDLLTQVLAVYESAIELDPDNAQTYWKLAEVHQTLGQMDEAIAVYTSVVERWPERADVHFRLGQAYEVQGETEAAVAAYERAIALKPTWANAYTRLGNLYKDQGRTEDVIALYRAAAKKNSAAAWPHIELGKVFLEQAKSQ